MDAEQVGTIGYREANGEFVFSEPILDASKEPRFDNLVERYAAENYNIKEI